MGAKIILFPETNKFISQNYTQNRHENKKRRSMIPKIMLRLSKNDATVFQKCCYGFLKVQLRLFKSTAAVFQKCCGGISLHAIKTATTSSLVFLATYPFPP